MTILKKSYNDLLAEIEALKAELEGAKTQSWMNTYQTGAMQGVIDRLTAELDEITEHYLALQRQTATHIKELKAERDAYKQAYEQAMLAGSDDTTADSFNEYYLAQSNREGSGWWNLVETSQAGDDAFDTPAFVSCDELEELVAELTEITEPIPYMDDDGEVA